MPIYEYICEYCDEDFEEFITKADAELNIHCPICQSTSIRRKFSLFGFSTGSSGETKSSSTSSCSSCTSKNCATCH